MFQALSVENINAVSDVTPNNVLQKLEFNASETAVLLQLLTGRINGKDLSDSDRRTDKELQRDIHATLQETTLQENKTIELDSLANRLHTLAEDLIDKSVSSLQIRSDHSIRMKFLTLMFQYNDPTLLFSIINKHEFSFTSLLFNHFRIFYTLDSASIPILLPFIFSRESYQTETTKRLELNSMLDTISKKIDKVQSLAIRINCDNSVIIRRSDEYLDPIKQSIDFSIRDVRYYLESCSFLKSNSSSTTSDLKLDMLVDKSFGELNTLNIYLLDIARKLNFIV